MIGQLSVDEVKTFFIEFLAKYKAEAEINCPPEKKSKLELLNGMPVKMDFIFDNGMNYGVVIFSKSDRGNEIAIENSLQDPMMVVAVANSKRYEYGNGRKLLYIFQFTAKKFDSWKVNEFVQDFVDYELSKGKF